jgi:hypothetical protein
MLRQNDAGETVIHSDWTASRMSSMYAPPRRWHIDSDMSRVQTALLYGPQRKSQSKILRSMSAIKAYVKRAISG